MAVTVFSGAGLSAESGAPTFRGVGGLYEGLTAEEVLSAGHYQRQPQEVEGIIDGLRSRIVQAEPNGAHLGIARGCRARPETRVVTQNVDDLLERAGVPDALHLHGEIGWLRCTNNPRHRELSGAARDPARRCVRCRARLRSDVVLFDEPAPRYGDLDRLVEDLTEADVFVVIGTPGNVVRIGEVPIKCPQRRNGSPERLSHAPRSMRVVPVTQASA